jgi:dipeptidyl aminopeptidase/acylaminoacyl peptidase
MNKPARFLALVLAALPCTASWAADPIPIADFFRGPQYSSAVMSPSGKYVALTVKGGQQNRQGLIVVDLADAKSKAIAGYVNADIIRVSWVNDERLVYSVTDSKAPAAEQYGNGLFAIDREGKETPRQLIQRDYCVASSGCGPGLSIFHYLHSVLRDGSNDVLLGRSDHNDRQFTGESLLRVNTTTGVADRISFGGPDAVRRWATDRRGTPRVAVTAFEGKSRLYWKATPEAPWTQVWEQPTYLEQRDKFNPMAVDSHNVLYSTSYYGDEDTLSLSSIDMQQPGAKAKSLLALKGYDFSGRVQFGPGGEILAVRYLTDARGTYWFSPEIKAIQAKVDALLPGLINELECGQCRDPRVFLVISWSDHQPRVFRIYDAKTGALSLLGQSRPWIDPKTMASSTLQRFAARDGLEIPVHVTLPKAQAGPPPAVIVVHGGPYLRGGEWEWNADSQFLVSRGYAVIEPEFRGSTGFGHKLFAESWKQWGLKMQDDIADATEWAVKQGYADRARICIFGASYGGYSALMGLARNPELYRCGVALAAPTDLDLIYTARWSDTSEMWKDYGMPLLVGEKGSKRLADASPINVAAKITQPLLLVYGEVDYRVPLRHGAKMRDALAPYNKSFEYVTYPEEGHGFALEANKVDFWGRVEKFLDRHLKNAQ